MDDKRKGQAENRQCNCELSPVHFEADHDALIDEIDNDAKAVLSNLGTGEIIALDRWIASHQLASNEFFKLWELVE